jgi:hypothetical protein
MVEATELEVCSIKTRKKPIPVAVRPLACRDRILPGHGCLFLLSVLCCQVEARTTC